MLDSATGTPETVAPDTTAPAPTAPVEAKVSSADIDAISEKVAEASTPKSEREKEDAEDAALLAEQRKAFKRADSKRDREENGKFAKPTAEHDKDASKALTPDSAPKAETKDQKPTEAAKPVAASPETPAANVPKPPQSWSPDKKAVWESMSPEAREIVGQREQDAHKAISKLGQFAKGFEPVAKTLSEYRETFESKGVSYQEGMKQLLDAQRTLDRDPVAGIKALAEAYGVNLGQSLSGQRDPAIHQLQAQVDNLTAELKEARAERQYRAQEEANTQQTLTNKLIVDFSQDKPDFDSLEVEIVANLRTLHETNPEMQAKEKLQTAYERAQWANPKTRQALMDRQSKDLDAKRLEEARKAADEAKRMRSINITSSDGPAGDFDENEMQRAAYRRAQAR